ncbi:jg5112 [Pararge aegeria aegeria]|uniref:Jg5112 protein n=1 Tax=Pararge aegeria aegeria TaxID=348720 RepID=A0A8S4S1A5_9NEOP|nr:jg5112 [Pararge aegeria aegeria]
MGWYDDADDYGIEIPTNLRKIRHLIQQPITVPSQSSPCWTKGLYQRECLPITIMLGRRVGIAIHGNCCTRDAIFPETRTPLYSLSRLVRHPQKRGRWRGGTAVF